MALTVTHPKVNAIAAWTQADLDAQIALGNYPPGTTLSQITLSSDWNSNHTVTGSISVDGITITGDGITTPLVAVTGAIGVQNAITFNPIAGPTYAAGKLLYDSDNESLTFYNNDSSVSLQIGQEEWIRVRNVTGVTIPNGSAVYMSGASSGLPTIALAQSNAAATTICIGLATESIANNAIGYVTCIGLVRGFDTSSFVAGSTAYLSSTVAGGLTSTAPSAPNYRYRVGVVGTSNAVTGTIHVTPSTAALGNGTANQIFGINNAGTAQEVKSITSTTSVTVVNAANSITLQRAALTGDIAAPVNSNTTTLATVNSNVGGFGSATQVGTFTVNAKGLVTAAANVTVTPAVGSITGLGTGVATALAVNVGTAGSFVVNGGALGTPSSGVATNLTGTASGLTAGTVTTNANLTGDVTSVGNATAIAAGVIVNADVNAAAGILLSKTNISLTTLGTSGASTLNTTTGVLNIPNYASGGGPGTVTSVDASNGVAVSAGSPITATGTIIEDHQPNAQTGTTYTYLTGDRGKVVTHSNALAIAALLPQSGSAGFASGWSTQVINLGVGTLTITPTISTINGAATLVLTTGQSAHIYGNGTNYAAALGKSSGGGGSPGGADTNVQFNNAGSFGATSEFTYSSGAGLSVNNSSFGSDSFIVTPYGAISSDGVTNTAHYETTVAYISNGTNTSTINATSVTSNTLIANTAAVPAASDGAALGTTSLQWSDLFLASGSVINFNNGDVTITHGAAGSGSLAFAGASAGYTFANGPVRPASNASASSMLGSSSVGWLDAYINVGASTGIGPVACTANINSTAVGNVGTGTDDLQTYTLPADAFNSLSGRGVKIKAWGSTAANANAKTLTLNFGSTVIFTRSMTVSVNNRWSIEAVILRTGASTQDYQIMYMFDGATAVTPSFGTSTQTETASIIIKCTGNATTNNDIVQEGFLIEMVN